MKKSFFKNLSRDIKKTFSRFISIVIIIAVGVSFYAGVRATSPDMKMSADRYFNKNNLMDFKIISPLGLTSDDILEIEKLKGTKKVQGSYSLDGVIEKNKKSLVVNVNSMPDEDGINKINILRGNRPKNHKEVVIEENFFKEYNFKINDKIIIKSGKENSIEDSLKNSEFTIVGTAQSPLYVSRQRQLSSVGNGSVKGFLYILPQVFKSEAFTEIYVKTDSDQSKTSLINRETYSKQMKNTEKNLKELGQGRSYFRYEEILKEANDKLNNSKKEAADKFSEGYKKLDNAREKLNKGKEELKNNEAIFDKKIKEGKNQIEDGKKQVQLAESEISKKTKEIEISKAQITEGKKELEASELKLNLGKNKAAENISVSILAKIEELKKEGYIEQYNILNGIYEKDIKGRDFDSIYNLLKQDGALEFINNYFDIENLNNNFKSGAEEIKKGRQKLLDSEKLIKQGEIQIKAGVLELEANKKKIEDSRVQLEKEKEKGIARLNKGKKELEDGEKEIDKNTKNLNSEEQKVMNKLREGEKEVEKIKDKFKDGKNLEWYVLGRTTNVGYETYRQDSDRIDNIGKVFPLIFFLVAALVSLTTMTRMVQENRIEIGTLKALGYSKTSIVAHYLIYSLSASLIGSLIGISFGYRLFPPLIMNAYSSLYTIPNKVSPFNVKLAFQASMLAILFTTVSAIAATLEELREMPAALMRPKPPKLGKKILLEKVTFLWKSLSFTSKVTARNIFRYKQRFFMTVIGIGACTGLMITGFGLKEGIIGSTENQFNKIYKYDMAITLTKNINDKEKDELKNKVANDSNIKSVLFTYLKNGTVSKGNSTNEDVYIVVPKQKEALNNYINLTMKGKNLKLEDGAIITEKLSKTLKKKIGDTIKITINDKVIEAKISNITEHYIQHYIYMSPSYYEKIYGEKLTYNGFYGLLKSTSESSQNTTSNNLRNNSSIQSVSFKNNAKIDINSSMESVNSVVIILIISAGALAFVVIYNLTNININERRRELATLKLLGFYDNELAAYIYRENIILTIIGSLFGIAMGILLNNLVITTTETNVIMFLKTIKPIYFLYSVIITIVFSIIVNLAMYKRFDKIDMIESLKSIE